MIRLIASDMDETMLNEKAQFSQRTLDAIRRAMDAGCLFSIASGRILEASMPYYEISHANAPIITSNGALIYDVAGGKALAGRFVPKELARAIAKKMENMGLYLQAFPGKGYFYCEPSEYTESYARRINVKGSSTHVPLSEWIDCDMVKLLSIVPEERALDIMEELRREFPEGVNIMRSHPTYIEIVAKGVDKGDALKKLAEALGIAREEVLAFGDGENDISMLDFAGTGCAVSNASELVRSHADLVIDSNLNDGPAKLIEQWLAEGKIGG